jgi:hypothetical protein
MRRRDAPVLDHLLASAGLEDACAVLQCPEPRRIDHVLFRSSPELALRATRWRIDERFVDSDGKPLSDHSAISVGFEWQARPHQIAAASVGSAAATRAK